MIQENGKWNKQSVIGRWFRSNPPVIGKVIGVLLCMPLLVLIEKGIESSYRGHGLLWAILCALLCTFIGYWMAVILFHAAKLLAIFLSRLLSYIFYNAFSFLLTLLVVLLACWAFGCF